jgi:uncharacterized membrane protein
MTVMMVMTIIMMTNYWVSETGMAQTYIVLCISTWKTELIDQGFTLGLTEKIRYK